MELPELIPEDFHPSYPSHMSHSSSIPSGIKKAGSIAHAAR